MIHLFWHRRDIRIQDNAGLYHALKSDHPVQPIFIFDKNILQHLPKDDARVHFIHQEIESLKLAYQEKGGDLWVFYDTPQNVFTQLLASHSIHTIFTNRDYEPYALERDASIIEIADSRSVPFKTFKDHVIFEKEEVVKADQTPYTVFTPYSKKWLEKAKNPYFYRSYPSEKYIHQLAQVQPTSLLTLDSMGFTPSSLPIPPKEVSKKIIEAYTENRNFPYLEDSTSKLGIHFRFGTISIREKARKAALLNATYLSELIWRDFYAMIISHFPHVAHHSFRPSYDKIAWRDASVEFERWCQGKTGYPMVDAGMRQLNATGWMHNRVRMVVASFLTKHLLIDWRLGEQYFAEKLLDFDLASNNGGWQWAAGSGTDAAPYFRIFNPTSQQEKFDPKFSYIKKWIPEYGTSSYVKPMVDHSLARERCLETYKKALNNN